MHSTMVESRETTKNHSPGNLGFTFPRNVKEITSGPQWPHLDFQSFQWKCYDANQLEGGLSTLELRILCVSPWVSDSPSCGKHVSYSRWWKIMLPQGGGKSEFEITFWAHPLFLEPPGPLRGSFQRRPQITPISILKLPFELLSSCAFWRCFSLLM